MSDNLTIVVEVSNPHAESPQAYERWTATTITEAAERIESETGWGAAECTNAVEELADGSMDQFSHEDPETGRTVEAFVREMP